MAKRKRKMGNPELVGGKSAYLNTVALRKEVGRLMNTPALKAAIGNLIIGTASGYLAGLLLLLTTPPQSEPERHQKTMYVQNQSTKPGSLALLAAR